VKFGGNLFAKKFPPNPLQEIHINRQLTDFPVEKIGKPGHIEIFLERGLG
jgi:hypothetical protein